MPLPRNVRGVLVPWAYREDCRPIAWSGRLDWIPEGTRGAVTGWLRSRDGWIDGRPTFDVEMAWRGPVWTKHEPRWPEAGEGGPRMDPEEFVQLYSAMPTFELLEREPRQAARRVRRWEREHPALALRAPAPAMLSYVYRHAEAQAGESTSDRSSLTGRWSVEVELLDSREPALPVTSERVRGELKLTLVPADTASSGPVYTGSSKIDFAPLGFRLGSPEVLAIAEPNGVRMILDPTVDHGHIVVTAAGVGDTLAGTWYLNSRPARASGRIRLRRVR